jgi:hypothetical protein
MRWEALSRRFPIKIKTQLPEEKELAKMLARKLRDLEMKLDEPRTLITLVRKVGRNPSRAVNVILSSYERGRQVFTSVDVAEA